MSARPVDLVKIARDATPSIVQLWRMLTMHRWLIIGTAIATTVLTAFIVFQMTPIYTSTATVLVEQNKNKVVSIDEVYSGISSNREYFQTQAEFLRSRDVAQRVVRQLGLVDNPLFDPRQPSWLSRILPGSSEPKSPDAIESIVIGRLQKNLTVVPLRQSQLIMVSFDSPDPVLAARIVNAVAENYIRADLDARFKMTATANSWLTERLAVLKDNLDSSEKALQAYRDQSGIVEGKNTSAGSAGRQLDELSQQLVQARVTRSQAEQVYNQVRSSSPSRYQVPAVFNNPSVARAREVEAQANAKLAEVGHRVGPAHPMYQAAANEYAAAKQNTQRQADAVISSIQKEFEVAAATERALEANLKTQRGSIQDLNRKEIKLDSLEREAASNRQIYQTFLSRVKETNATGDFLTPIARVVDPGAAPLLPSKPEKLQLTILGALLGLILGSVIAWMIERLTNLVRSTDDVELKLQRPLLAAVPKLPPEQIERGAYVQIEHPGSHFAESVRTVLTGIQLSSINMPHPVVAFTSTVPGEGKSTLAINFALEQARTKRVLLIDLDLRRPTVGSKLGLAPDAKGASDLLSGTADLSQTIYKVGSMELSVMPGGRQRPSPLDLIAGPRFAESIRLLQNSFDMIVIDTPPMHVVADVLLIGAVCTGVVYVVKSADTSVPVITRNLSRLDAAGLDVMGIVLNHHDFKKAERYYGEYGNYGSYGYDTSPTESAK